MTNEQTIKERAQKMEARLEEIKAFVSEYFHSDSAWTLKKLLDYQAGLFTFAKFSVGDRVQLAVTLDINPRESWGWLDSKHFLVLDARGVVRGRDWRGGFEYDVEFDDESWLDEKGVKHPTDQKHLYLLSEAVLKAEVPA